MSYTMSPPVDLPPVQTVDEELQPYVYAGFWRRFGATFIDSVIVAAGTLLPAFLIMLLGVAVSDDDKPPTLLSSILMTLGVILYVAGPIVGGWLYEALMVSSVRQATLGKKAFGLIVTDTSGNRLTFGRATGRHFAKLISGVILLIGYIMAAFTERKQALHDLIASTLVLKV
jgi:uncharacterized RDD family membrane protein YckC